LIELSGAVSFFSSKVHSPFDDLDLLPRQPIQLVHQPVNLPVGGLDLALVELLVGGNGGGGELLVQRLPLEPLTPLILLISLTVTPSAHSAPSSYSAVQRFDDRDFFLRQPIQLVHQRVNLNHETHERARKPRNSLSCLSPPFASFVFQTPSTMPTSSSANPHNSGTSASISLDTVPGSQYGYAGQCMLM